MDALLNTFNWFFNLKIDAFGFVITPLYVAILSIIISIFTILALYDN